MDLCGVLKQTRNQATRASCQKKKEAIALKKLGILASQQGPVGWVASEVEAERSSHDVGLCLLKFLPRARSSLHPPGENEQSIEYFQQA